MHDDIMTGLVFKPLMKCTHNELSVLN